MRRLSQKKWLFLFGSIALVIFVQVGWWTYVFTDNVSTIEGLRLELGVTEPAQIQNDSFRKKNMFYSESVFFVLLTCFGFYLLYRGYRSELKLRETQKNFVEILSHESKTPLTALKLRLESLAESSESTETQIQASLALDEVRRLATIFEKTLHLNRLDAHGFQRQTVHLSDLVEEISNRLGPIFRSRNVALEMSLDTNATVQGDPHAIQNSIQNLMENSVFYNSSKSKKMKVDLQATQSKVFLSIDDNGPGIAQKDLPHIFERFYRGKNMTQTPGTGLGLFIAKYVVEAHRGSLRLLPTQLGGSHFQMELPGASA